MRPLEAPNPYPIFRTSPALEVGFVYLGRSREVGKSVSREVDRRQDGKTARRQEQNKPIADEPVSPFCGESAAVVYALILSGVSD